MTTVHEGWLPTACILCSRNCGLEVQLDGQRLAKIRGDERHPLSAGYLCQKAARLDHYQNHQDRLDTPLRRTPAGAFEPVSWEAAFTEIAARLTALRLAHGGRAFAYYGGGGQGNHLGGVYGRALLDVMGSRYHYTALAQEKTGDFWVNGRLFGKQTCHVTEGVEEADLVVIIGTNPWQSHGIPNARDTLRALANDPARTLVVIDPKRSETAALARHHLRVRPGTDAFLLSAVLATAAVLVGGLLLARAVPDGALSERILRASRRLAVPELAAEAQSAPPPVKTARPAAKTALPAKQRKSRAARRSPSRRSPP